LGLLIFGGSAAAAWAGAAESTDRKASIKTQRGLDIGPLLKRTIYLIRGVGYRLRKIDA
jgi:hypothetical protein